MAAFSYHHQYHPLLLHPAYLPSSPCTEMTNSSSSTCLILQHNNPSSIAIPNPSESEAMPSFESSSGSGSSLGSVRVAFPVVSGTGTQMNSNGGQEQLPPTPQASMEKKKKKRKSRDCTSLCSAQPKDAKGNSRKQKEHAEEKKVEADDGKGEAKPSDQEPPKGYIHVRARRGQATDSHSLAERVRREKIRERMDLLQGLVPGCDKITGKALMLDEIINYVQSLQNQVEFLSMKLASMNPMLYDFGFHLDGHTDHQPQTMGSMTQGSLTVPSVLQTSTPIYHHTALEDATCRNYPMMETSTPLLLHGQGSIALPPQDNGSVLMQVADKRQELLNLAVFNNMCSFQ